MLARVASTASAALVSAESTVRAMPAAAASMRLPAASLMLSIRARCADRRCAAPPATSSTSRARSASADHLGGEHGDALVGVAPGFAQRRGERVDLRLDARQIGDQHAHIGEGGGGGGFELLGLAGERARLAAHRRADLGQPQRRILAEREQLLGMFGDGLAIIVDPRRRARATVCFQRGRLAAHRGGGAAEAAAPRAGWCAGAADRRCRAGRAVRWRATRRAASAATGAASAWSEVTIAAIHSRPSTASAMRADPLDRERRGGVGLRLGPGGAAAAAPPPARRVEWLRAMRDVRAIARSIVAPVLMRAGLTALPVAEEAARNRPFNVR